MNNKNNCFSGVTKSTAKMEQKKHNNTIKNEKRTGIGEFE